VTPCSIIQRCPTVSGSKLPAYTPRRVLLLMGRGYQAALLRRNTENTLPLHLAPVQRNP
jgi:hypothetical protein